MSGDADMSKEKRKKQFGKDYSNQSDVLSSSCSVTECTGLIPAGNDLSEDEFRNYQDIFQFSVPPDMPE